MIPYANFSWVSNPRFCAGRLADKAANHCHAPIFRGDAAAARLAAGLPACSLHTLASGLIRRGRRRPPRCSTRRIFSSEAAAVRICGSRNARLFPVVSGARRQVRSYLSYGKERERDWGEFSASFCRASGYKFPFFNYKMQ